MSLIDAGDMIIEDLTTHWIIGAAPHDSLREAAAALAGSEVGALVVFDRSGPAGIFSERDLVRAVADRVDLEEALVEEYMTESPVHLDHTASLQDAITEMSEQNLRHLAVSERGEITGVISARDILRALAKASTNS